LKVKVGQAISPAHFLLLVLSLPAWATDPAANLAKSLREAGLDPQECYRVRDLSFQREDIKLYFTDGYLIFSKPVAGSRVSAMFSADVEGGDGEILMLPPHRGERQSLARFTESPNLDEHLRAALIVSTDGSVDALRERVASENAGRKVADMGPVLVDKWAQTLRNIQTGFELRLVQDLLSPSASRAGMTFLALSGKQLGNFDALYDLRSREQIMAGQIADRDGRLVYNIWTSFLSRGARNGSLKPVEPGFGISKFQIDATLDADLRMKVTTRATVRLGADPLRVFGFDLAHAMRVTAVRVDGAPAELLFQDSVRSRALRGSDNDSFLVAVADALAPGSEHQFEFEHEGAVIATAGAGVFYVGARANWYPRSGNTFAAFDLIFRYPKRLTLVTPGELVEDRIDGEQRYTRRRTPPIRVAGFNLGEYEKASRSLPGFEIEVYGNRHLENALLPKPMVLAPSNPVPRVPRREAVAVQTAQSAPDPLGRLRAVANDVASSLEFFSGMFGAPAMKTLTVAPIPGTFGQGFPGLLYLSTMAYIDPAERPAALRDRGYTVFFSELLVAHETAHQWWGNVVTSGSYRDEWLGEALASYSALMWLEKKKGTKAVEGVLEEYRDRLVRKGADGKATESAGPIIWGPRLESAMPDAWRAVTYDKGAWIIHMLRRRLGDERFQSMLAETRRKYEFRPLSTEDFSEMVKRFVPPRTSPEWVDAFFDNWVYSTGVPSLKLRTATKGVAPALKLSGTVSHGDVDEDFSADVPVEIQFAKGPPQVVWVRSSSEGTPFTVTLKQAPVRVAIGSFGILARR
jgi:hypothetical protein